MRLKLGGPLLLIGALLVLAACGGDDPTASPTGPKPTATAAPVANTPLPATPTATVAPTITPQPTASAAPTTPPPTQTPAAITAPTPEPTAELPSRFSEYGFDLVFERGAAVQVLGAASPEQGAVTFAYGEVNAIVAWLPQGNSLLALASGVYDIVKSSQPDLDFDTLADGEMLVDGEPGFFLGFKAQEISGEAKGGLIGSWNCDSSGTAFALALTGTDAILVQIRFNELLDNFACVAS